MNKNYQYQISHTDATHAVTSNSAAFGHKLEISLAIVTVSSNTTVQRTLADYLAVCFVRKQHLHTQLVFSRGRAAFIAVLLYSCLIIGIA